MLVPRHRRVACYLVAATMLVAALPFSAATAAQQAGVAVGTEAPDFTLESTDGATYRLSDLRGEKNVVLIFFRGAW